MGVSRIGGGISVSNHSTAKATSFEGELQSLRDGMRPAFGADLKRALDKLYGSMSQDQAGPRDYGVLANVLDQVLQKYDATLSPAEKATLQKTTDAFRAKASGWSFAGDKNLLAGVPVNFPSLAVKAGASQGFGIHLQHTDDRVSLQLKKNDPTSARAELKIEKHEDPKFRQSALRATVNGASAEVIVTKDMSAQAAARALGEALAKQDPSIKFEVGPGGSSRDLGIDTALIQLRG